LTAREVLDEVLRAGGRVIADPARPRVAVPPRLKPLVLEHREALRALVLEVSTPTLPAASPSSWGGYSHPWPDSLPGLGLRAVGPFDRCAECERWSWVRYGDRVLCLHCSQRRRALGKGRN